MNDYASLRKQNKSRALAVVFLAVCVLLSSTVLCSRLLTYSTADTCHYIPLTRSGGITHVIAGQMDAEGNVHFDQASTFSPDQPRLLAYSPILTSSWFETRDKTTVWKGRTDIDIFRFTYKNGSGQVTAASGNGEKIIAPGTSGTYSFALENTGKNGVIYEMTMEAYFSDGTHTIPVLARVRDGDGKYLAGSAKAAVDVLELNKVSDSGWLYPSYVMPYTLEWEWPFETDDEYDTLLGDLAKDADITLTIVIHTSAYYSLETGETNGIPKTGDTSNVGLMMAVMVASAAGLMFLLLLPKRKGDTHAEA